MSGEYEVKAVSKLCNEPYKSYMLLMYDTLHSIKKFRKKIVKIENEISWFNGIHTSTKSPDYMGFYNHITKCYFDVNNATIEPRYKAIFDYTYGEEPQTLYFVMLYVKRLSELELFGGKCTEEDLKKDKRLTEQYLKLFNELKLLFCLLEKMDRLVLVILNSYDLSKIQHLDEDNYHSKMKLRGKSILRKMLH